MSNQAKTVIGLVIVVVVTLATFLLMGPVIGLGIAVVGGLALWVVLERTGEGFELPGLRRGPDEDEAFDPGETGSRHVQPLSTWTPPETLTPWSPPAEASPPLADATTDAGTPPRVDDDFWSPGPPRDDFSDLTTPTEGEPTSWLDESTSAESTWGTADLTWEDGSTWDATGIPTEANPLDDLARLDEIDVIAEFERLDDREVPPDPTSTSTSTSMFDVPAPPVHEVLSPINEAVSSADDIMAASHATELHVEQDDNSELAKLLAKVQARLAAYE